MHWTEQARRSYSKDSEMNALKMENLFTEIWKKYNYDEIPKDVVDKIEIAEQEYSEEVQEFVLKYFWEDMCFDYDDDDQRYEFNEVEQGDSLMALVEEIANIVGIKL